MLSIEWAIICVKQACHQAKVVAANALQIYEDTKLLLESQVLIYTRKKAEQYKTTELHVLQRTYSNFTAQQIELYITHKEFSLSWAQRIFINKPMLVLYQLHSDSHTEHTMSMITEYLLAIETLPHSAQCTELMTNIFGNMMCTISCRSPLCIGCYNHKQWNHMYELMQTIHVRQKTVSSMARNALYLHSYLNEIVCLLLSLHDAMYTHYTSTDTIVNITNVYNKYTVHTTTLCASYAAKYSCCDRVMHMLRSTDNVTVLYGTLVTMQMFLAHSAQRTMVRISQQIFNEIHEQHIDRIMEIVSAHRTHKLCEKLHNIAYMRIARLLQTMFIYRALETYMLNFMQVNAIYTTTMLHDDAVILMYIIRNNNELMCHLTAQLMSHLRASLLIHIINNRVLLNSENIKRLLSILKYKEEKQILLQKTLDSFNAYIVYILRAHLCDDNINIRAIERIVNKVFSLEHPTNNRRNALFKEHIYTQLETILFNMHTDEQFACYAPRILMLLMQQQNNSDEFAIDKRYDTNNELHFIYNSKNIYVLANMWMQHDLPISLDTLRDSNCVLDDAHIDVYKSHVIYVALENMLREAHHDIVQQVTNYGKHLVTFVHDNALNVIVTGYTCYSLYCLARDLSLWV